MRIISTLLPAEMSAHLADRPSVLYRVILRRSGLDTT